jgi:hypothetical protein
MLEFIPVVIIKALSVVTIISLLCLLSYTIICLIDIRMDKVTTCYQYHTMIVKDVLTNDWEQKIICDDVGKETFKPKK